LNVSPAKTDSAGKLRLAYLVSQYPTLSHTFILREIRALRELGCEIEVITIRPSDRPPDQLGPEEREEAARTWTVLRAGPGSFLAAHARALLTHPLRYFGGMGFAIRLARLNPVKTLFNLIYFAEAVVAGWRIHRRGFQHLHTHFSSTVALFAARVFPLTFSATIHGSDEFIDPTGFYLPEKVAAARFLVTISHYGRSQLMRVSRPEHWRKIEVSPLGVDPSRFQPAPRAEHLGRFEILSVGRLVSVKGYPVLIDAVGALVKKGRASIHLRLAGDGPERAALEQWISAHALQAHVTLEGACTQERVRELYRDADVFALSSFAEGVPVVLMEAMAMEVACVAPWITGIPELIRHGVDGLLVPAADVNALAEAIERLMDDASLRSALGRAGRARVLECYDLSRNTSRLCEIYTARLGH
jgi:glycosyltransferase involved in cell wall biosynthesis